MCQLTYFYFFWTRFTKNSPKLRAWFTWIQALGEVHVIVSNEATTLENVGQFGKFSKTGDFFNVQTKSLDMHIRHSMIASVFALREPSHTDGKEVLSFQFFDQRGDAAFKVFLTFGGKDPEPERLSRYDEIIE